MKKAGAVHLCEYPKRTLGCLLFALILFLITSNALLSQPSQSCIVSSTEPSCFGSADGSIKAFNTDTDITVTNKKYELYKKGILTNTFSSMTPYTFNGLSPDSFSVKMYSFIGSSSTWLLFCTKDIVLASPQLLGVTGVKGDVTCKGMNNGNIILTVNGGTTPYDYTWSNGSGTKDINNLAPGNYIVFVSDVRGCTTDKSFLITEPSKAVSLVKKFQNSDCTNKTGSIDITVSGGTSPYKYKWSNDATTSNLSGLASGKYVVAITDSQKCAIADSVTLTAPPSLINLKTTVTPVSCNGGNNGAATVIINQAKAPFTILWPDGTSSASISGLKAGTYSVTVVDSNNCTSSATANIVEPSVFVLNKKVTDINCKGDASGAIDVTVLGGTNPYSYAWSDGSTTQSIKNLIIGNYSLTAADVRGCKDSFNVSITEPKLPLKTSVTHVDLTCKGANSGSADLTVTGGTAPYSFQWNPNGAVTEDLTGIAAGIYTVIVTDSKECLSAAKVTINEPADLLLISSNVTPVRCQGESNGAISLSTVGGLSPYSYLWSQNGTTADNLAGLSSGLYSVVITDGNNCRVVKDIIVTQPDLIKAELTTSIGCTGQDGEIDLYTTGGTEPYSYIWSNGAVTENLLNLVPGLYSVIITDFRACSLTDSVSITEEAHGCINVPNGFSPNSDGTNDTWILRNIESFPKSVVDVFDREGNSVFNSLGYAIPWNGTLNGRLLPIGTYYYVINLNNGDKQISGSVTILR